MIDLPLLFLVLAAGSVAALNPCTISVLILLISTVLGRGRSTPRMVWLGITFVLTLFVLSVAIGLGALYLFNLVPLAMSHYLLLLIGLIVIAAGVIEIKDYFWYGQGISLRIAEKPAAVIRSMIKRKMGIGRAISVGLLTGLVAIPCISAPYMASIAILRDLPVAPAIGLILLYNVLFVLPLVALLLVVASGVKISAIQRWKEDGKGKMRLGIGLLVVVLGWILMLIASGVLNFG